jgi:hypothetical protein
VDPSVFEQNNVIDLLFLPQDDGDQHIAVLKLDKSLLLIYDRKRDTCVAAIRYIDPAKLIGLI